MIVTAEEAKTKWCPFARVRPAMTDAGAVNRLDRGDDPSAWPHCIADSCMAWRWVNQPANEAKHKGSCGLVEKEAA
jgi:hypothetical protein